MTLTGIELIILILASFRITRLIVYDTITEWVRRPFHNEIRKQNDDGEWETYIEVKGKGIQAFIGELLSCHWCTGFWVSAVVLIGFIYVPFLMPLWILFAISGGGALLFEVFHH